MTPFLADPDVTLWHGDALEVLRQLPDDHADACVTSPPYLDARPEYPSPSLHAFEEIFRELGRVVDGPLCVNVGRLWRHGTEQLWWVDLLRAATRAGWSHLDTIVWRKLNANPIHGRVVANQHEYVLLLGDAFTQFNEDAVRRPYTDEGKARMARRWINHRSVKGTVAAEGSTRRELNPVGARAWSVYETGVGKEKGNEHPAPMALDLAKHLVLLASWPGDKILDPFGGSGTTALAARLHGRSAVLVELSEDYCGMAARRLQQLSLLAEGAA